MLSENNQKLGATIGTRFHELVSKIVLADRTFTREKFCEKIQLNYTTFSTLKQGTKLLNAVNLYYLITEYPQTDLYWLLTGESRKDDNLLVREEKAVKTAPISIEEQLSKAQEEITFLREQNRQMSQTILNLSARI